VIRGKLKIMSSVKHRKAQSDPVAALRAKVKNLDADLFDAVLEAASVQARMTTVRRHVRQKKSDSRQTVVARGSRRLGRARS
jgi:hypothetical protein